MKRINEIIPALLVVIAPSVFYFLFPKYQFSETITNGEIIVIRENEISGTDEKE